VSTYNDKVFMLFRDAEAIFKSALTTAVADFTGLSPGSRYMLTCSVDVNGQVFPVTFDGTTPDINGASSAGIFWASRISPFKFALRPGQTNVKVKNTTGGTVVFALHRVDY
jgi:hypothetical protein